MPLVSYCGTIRQSICFCSPLKLAFMKETEESILYENEYLMSQIGKLQLCKIILSDKKH